jgi:Zn-dependent peptidase ImmA (M78 family)
MFERGFKTWCEKYSTSVRGELSLGRDGPLDTRALALHLKVRVWTPEDVPGLNELTLRTLLRNDGKSPSCWSAVTLVLNGKALVILNSSHSKARQASDLTHELAHRILKHETHEVSVSPDGLMLIANYDKQQEEQADWLSGCLLLPRDALLSIRRKRMEDALAASEYGVSLQMLKYRMAMTGVDRQYGRGGSTVPAKKKGTRGARPSG